MWYDMQKEVLRMKNLKKMAAQFREELHAFLETEATLAKSGVEQTINDMKKRLATGKALVAEAMAEEERLKRACHEAIDTVKAWGEKADAALKNGQTALAREALRQQRKHSARLTRFQEELETQKAIVANAKATLQEFYQRFQNAVERAESLQTRQKQAATRVDFYKIFNKKPDDAAFKAAEQRVKATEAQADSMQNAEDSGIDTEPPSSAEGAKKSVDDALAQLKDDILGK